MFNKLLLLFSLYFITVMTGIAFYTEKNYDENLLLSALIADNESNGDMEVLDRINEEKFMLSYQNSFSAAISTEQKNWDVIMKASNYTLPYVWQHPSISGSFFTKEHQEQSSRVAVLNEPAAFELFGGYDITANEITYKGQIFYVVGVINDGDKKVKNIYIPITCTEYKPDLISAVMEEEKGITPEYVKSVLKQAGIKENHDFINISSLSAMPGETAALSVIIAGLIACIFLVAYLMKNLFCQIKLIKISLKDYYIYGLISNRFDEVLKLFALACSTFIFSALFLTLIIQFTNIFLGWRLKLSNLLKNGFSIQIVEIEFLGNLNLYSWICFLGFILMISIFLWMSLKKSV